MEVTEYRFQGNEGEVVPERVQKLTFHPWIRFLPDDLCTNRTHLREVTLPQGLIKIGRDAFSDCTSLFAIKICGAVEYIENYAFMACEGLVKIEFESSSSSAHRLTIGEFAFHSCLALERIKLPSSVNTIANSGFESCLVLLEADLSATSITKISREVFAHCHNLQNVSLPNSLERICYNGFYDCGCLVTVIVPLGSQSIKIEDAAFDDCSSLANIVLPKGSKAQTDSFDYCALLQNRFGEEADSIVDGLVARFDGFPVHRLCYDHSSVTAQELGQCIERSKDEGSPLVDEFGMTPFHVLFTTVGSRQDLLEVLLEKYPYNALGWRDANDKLASEYFLVSKTWTRENEILLQIILQRGIVDPIVRWGAPSWRRAMQNKVQDILSHEVSKEQRASLCTAAYSAFAKYEGMEATSILEMALWKAQLKGGLNNATPQQQALEREECRCVCGSDGVIPSVTMFLGIS
ncbi:unnamed protein product [Cylindrotheca closterium]|uniref:Leucine-rich repeat domain-containing protein n=1 Tax=Cylindrotheca closterium TaxID=2856 RepID=A0AAD2G4F4_9STRA|nr:unnamed protein product [Cylindrotheca closterium]